LAQLNLTAEGYHVVVHRDGASAIVCLQEELPDLVLLDLRLPTAITGWDLLAYVRQDDRLRHVPVVVVSAFAHEQERKLAYAAGANDSLVKPFGLSDLFACVKRWVEVENES